MSTEHRGVFCIYSIYYLLIISSLILAQKWPGRDRAEWTLQNNFEENDVTCVRRNPSPMVRRYRIVDIYSVSTEPVCAAAGSLQPGPRLRDGGAAPGAAPARAGAGHPGDRAHQHAALQAPGAASHRAAAQTRTRGDKTF